VGSIEINPLKQYTQYLPAGTYAIAIIGIENFGEPVFYLNISSLVVLLVL
jgi:hypothetical protein